jgi:hypothetical protein
MRPGGCKTYSGSLIPCRLLLTSLSNVIIPLLADHYERGKFFRHIAVGEGIFQSLRQPHPQGIPQGRRIPLKISGNNLKLTIILRELTVLLFNLPHLSFSGGYPVAVPKSCFQEFYKSLWVFEPCCSVLPDLWQDLAKGYSPPGVESVSHLRLFVGKAGGLVSYDHPELTNPASQLRLIRPGKVCGVAKSLVSVLRSLGSSQGCSGR